MSAINAESKVAERPRPCLTRTFVAELSFAVTGHFGS